MSGGAAPSLVGGWGVTALLQRLYIAPCLPRWAPCPGPGPVDPHSGGLPESHWSWTGHEGIGMPQGSGSRGLLPVSAGAVHASVGAALGSRGMLTPAAADTLESQWSWTGCEGIGMPWGSGSNGLMPGFAPSTTRGDPNGRWYGGRGGEMLGPPPVGGAP